MNLPTINNLSPEQYDALMIPLDESSIVTGPPGSGKTVIAILRLRQAIANGQKTKLITHRRVLKGFTDYFALTGDDGSGIYKSTSTFDAWFSKEYWRLFKSKPPTPSKNNWFIYNWELIIEAVIGLQDAQALSQGDDVDVIIDEAQDLPADFFLFAKFLGATTTIFADEYQRLTATNSTLREIRTNSGISRVISLKTNFRNTRAIAEFAEAVANKFNPDHQPLDVTNVPERRGGKGQNPLLFQGSTTTLEEFLSRIISYAVNNPKQTIGILTPRTTIQTDLYERLIDMQKNMRLDDLSVQQYASKRVNIDGKWQSMPTPNWEKSGIYLLQYASGKGLEFDLVCLPELNQLTGDLGNPDSPVTGMTFYTMITRARQDLWMSYSGENDPNIISLFPQDKITRT